MRIVDRRRPASQPCATGSGARSYLSWHQGMAHFHKRVAHAVRGDGPIAPVIRTLDARLSIEGTQVLCTLGEPRAEKGLSGSLAVPCRLPGGAPKALVT